MFRAIGAPASPKYASVTKVIPPQDLVASAYLTACSPNSVKPPWVSSVDTRKRIPYYPIRALLPSAGLHCPCAPSPVASVSWSPVISVTVSITQLGLVPQTPTVGIFDRQVRKMRFLYHLVTRRKELRPVSLRSY